MKTGQVHHTTPVFSKVIIYNDDVDLATGLLHIDYIRAAESLCETLRLKAPAESLLHLPSDDRP